VEAVGESRSHFEIAKGLAGRLGITDFDEKTEVGWLDEIVRGCPGLSEPQRLRDEGIRKVTLPEPYVPFAEYISGGQSFPTSSGKIELYSQTIANLEGGCPAGAHLHPSMGGPR